MSRPVARKGIANGEIIGPSSRAEHAFVTLLTTDSFGPGAQVLLHSLRTSISAKDKDVAIRPVVVVLVTPEISERTRKGLEGFCDELLTVEPIANPYAENSHVSGWVDSGFTKLQIWGLTQFERVVYLDADCLVVEDIQELFSADVDFAAAPDIFPPDRFNAGVMLVRPNLDVYEDMLRAVEAGALPSYDGGDTGFLNAFFPKWYSSPLVRTGSTSSSFSTCGGKTMPQKVSMARLPFIWNAQRTLHWMTHAVAPGYWGAVATHVKILHFSSSPKPWEPEGVRKKGELEVKWWTTFVEMHMAKNVT